MRARLLHIMARVTIKHVTSMCCDLCDCMFVKLNECVAFVRELFRTCVGHGVPMLGLVRHWYYGGPEQIRNDFGHLLSGYRKSVHHFPDSILQLSNTELEANATDHKMSNQQPSMPESSLTQQKAGMRRKSWCIPTTSQLHFFALHTLYLRPF